MKFKSLLKESILEEADNALNESNLEYIVKMLAAVPLSAWAGFSWAKSVIAAGDFVKDIKKAKGSEERKAVIKKYFKPETLLHVVDPNNLGTYTDKKPYNENDEMSDSDSSSSISSTSDEYGGKMLRSQLQRIIMCAGKIHDHMQNHDKAEPWVEDHISRAMELVSQVAGYVRGEEDSEGEEQGTEDHMIVSLGERKLSKKEKKKK